MARLSPRIGRRPWILGWAAVVAVATAQACAAADAPAAAADLGGVWRNPEDSVHVEIRPCGGAGQCGYVVWADSRAKADARRGGTAQLVGTQLFRNLARDAAGRWRGKVFVPDLNATFRGTAQLLGARRLQAKGCLLGDILCKSQVWTRLDGAAPPEAG